MLEHNSRNKDVTKKEETQVTLLDLMGLSRAQLDIDPQKATSHHHICRNPSSTTPAELVELTFLLGTLGFLHEKTLLLSLFLLSPCSGSASPPTNAPPQKRGAPELPPLPLSCCQQRANSRERKEVLEEQKILLAFIYSEQRKSRDGR